MPSFYFEVYCSCGRGLCRQTTVEQDKEDKITVDPCPDCLEEAKNKGNDEGHEKGYLEGLREEGK